ncbi:hypothetical protein L6452_34349 [Arctium lappa]|uniref:Uncharacterized protein n=1 Tax=Arctium lappa TaxID=4217 RepID=A0ACB8YHZ8_ARCLA|nr:hypothetical protein L6452_34349 [Arctium lappa]
MTTTESSPITTTPPPDDQETSSSSVGSPIFESDGQGNSFQNDESPISKSPKVTTTTSTSDTSTVQPTTTQYKVPSLVHLISVTSADVIPGHTTYEDFIPEAELCADILSFEYTATLPRTIDFKRKENDEVRGNEGVGAPNSTAIANEVRSPELMEVPIVFEAKRSATPVTRSSPPHVESTDDSGNSDSESDDTPQDDSLCITCYIGLHPPVVEDDTMVTETIDLGDIRRAEGEE